MCKLLMDVNVKSLIKNEQFKLIKTVPTLKYVQVETIPTCRHMLIASS